MCKLSSRVELSYIVLSNASSNAHKSVYVFQSKLCRTMFSSSWAPMGGGWVQLLQTNFFLHFLSNYFFQQSSLFCREFLFEFCATLQSNSSHATSVVIWGWTVRNIWPVWADEHGWPGTKQDKMIDDHTFLCSSCWNPSHGISPLGKGDT